MLSQSQIRDFVIPTIAAAALVGRTNEVAFVKECNRFYSYTAGALTPDGVNVLASGTAGYYWVALSGGANGLTAWDTTNDYVADDVVVYNGYIAQANDAVPAMSAFEWGTSGATWTLLYGDETLTWTGKYSGATSYTTANVVGFGPKVYVCLLAISGTAPSTVAGNKYWAQLDNYRLDAFTAATSTNAGVKGSVPAPDANFQDAQLIGDGTWDRTDRLSYAALSNQLVNVTLDPLTTVDISGAIDVAQTTPDITITLPAPTVTTKERRITVINTGSADMTVSAAKDTAIAAASAWQFIWSPTALDWFPLTPPVSTFAVWTLEDGNGNVSQQLSGKTISTAYTLSTGVATLASGVTGTMTGIQSGSGTFRVTGGGTLTVAAQNAYTGITTLSAGVTMIGSGATIGSLGYGNIVNNASLVYNMTVDQTLSNIITGTGALFQQGASTLTLLGANNYSGITSVASGATIQVGNGGSAGTIGTGSAIVNGVLRFNKTSAVSFPGTIQGSGSLALVSPTSLTLTGDSTFAGTATIPSGATLVMGGGVASGKLKDTTITNSGTVNFDYGAGASVEMGSYIVGSGGINFVSGESVFTGWANTSNQIVVDSGAQITLTSGRLGVGTGGAQTGTGGNYGGRFQNNGTVKMAASAIAYSQQDFSSDVSGTGTWIVEGSNSTIQVGARCTFTGPIQILNGGTFSISGGMGTMATPFTYAGSVTNNGVLQVITGNTDQQVLTGGMTGTGSILLAFGTLVLKGTNTFSGGVNYFSVFGGQTLTVGDGTAATATMSGAGTIALPYGVSQVFNWNNAYSTTPVVINANYSGGGTVNYVGQNSTSLPLYGQYKLTTTTSPSFTGPVNVSGARLEVASVANVGAASKVTIQSGGQLWVSTASTFTRPVTINTGSFWYDGATSTYGSIRCDVAVTFSGAMVIDRSGTTFGSANASTITLSGAVSGVGQIGASTYTSVPTIVISGTCTTTSGVLAVNGGTIVVTGTVSAGVTVNTSGKVSGGTAQTGTCGSLTFNASSSALIVNAITTSSVSVLTTGTLTASTGFTVNVAGTLNAGTYAILVKSSGSSTVPTLGTNTSGRTITFAWSGNNLNMTAV